MTTQEKIRALTDFLGQINPRDLPPEIRDLVEGFQIMQGMGIVSGGGLFEFLLPADPGDAEQTIDKVIGLLLDLRGDDLPPYDPNRYGESIVAEILRHQEGEPA